MAIRTGAGRLAAITIDDEIGLDSLHVCYAANIYSVHRAELAAVLPAQWERWNAEGRIPSAFESRSGTGGRVCAGIRSQLPGATHAPDRTGSRSGCRAGDNAAPRSAPADLHRTGRGR